MLFFYFQNEGNVTIKDLVHLSAHQPSRFPASSKWHLYRSRDHGVPSYLKVLRLCEPTTNIRTYADFDKMGFTRSQKEIMADMYRYVISGKSIFSLSNYKKKLAKSPKENLDKSVIRINYYLKKQNCSFVFFPISTLYHIKIYWTNFYKTH